MAWFSKPRRAEPVTPGRCARCGERPGSTLIHFHSGPGAPPLPPAERVAWLCDACADAVRREAGDN